MRAGLAHDPKDYRFCGYAEAVAGKDQGREGLRSVVDGATRSEFQANYRQILFGTGAGPREHDGSISMEHLSLVFETGGELPLADVLRCRVRYFADGAVLGSRAFVTHHLARYRTKTGRRHDRDVHEVSRVSDWGEPIALRPLRRSPFG